MHSHFIKPGKLKQKSPRQKMAEQDLQVCSKTKNMEKVTFTFPTYNDLWIFKDKTKAINVKVTPKKNTISGMFQKQEIELAINQFHAVTVKA